MGDRWDFYFCLVQDRVASIAVDLALKERLPMADRPLLCWVWVELQQPREDGLADTAEAERLDAIEAELVKAFREEMDAVYAGRITTDGRREHYFYAADEAEAFDTALGRAHAEFPDYALQAGIQPDPEAGHYLEVLYPTPLEQQFIANRHRIEALVSAGDEPEQERPISHWLYFPTREARDEVAEAVGAEGYEVVQEIEVEDEECPHGLVLQRSQSAEWGPVNDATGFLMTAAEGSGGRYHAWEAPVTRADIGEA